MNVHGHGHTAAHKAFKINSHILPVYTVYTHRETETEAEPHPQIHIIMQTTVASLSKKKLYPKKHFGSRLYEVLNI